MALVGRRELSLGRWGGGSRAGGCSTDAICDGGSASGAPLAASVNSQSVNAESVQEMSQVVKGSPHQMTLPKSDPITTGKN